MKIKEFIGRHFLLTIIIIFIAKFAINVFLIANTSIGYDESFSIFHSQKSFKAINNVCMWDVSSPFYYYCLHVWMKIFGNDYFSTRMLSSLFNAVSTGLLFGFLYKKANLSSAIFALFLFSSSDLFFFTSQQTRAYALIIMLYVASTWVYYNLCEHPKLKWMLLLGVVNYMIVLSHYIAGLIIVFQVLLLFDSFSKKKLYYYLGASIVTLLLLNRWIIRAWEIFTSGGNSLAQPISLNTLYSNTLELFNNNKWVLIADLMIIVVGLGFYISKALKRRIKKMSVFNLLYFSLLGVGSMLIMALLSFRTPMFLSRYLITAYLGIILLTVYLFSFIRLNVALKTGIAIVPVMLSFLSINYVPYHGGLDYKNMVEYVKERENDKTLIILQTIDIQSLFAYYYNQSVFKNYNNLTRELSERDIYSANDSISLSNIDINYNYYQQVILVQTYQEFTDPSETLTKYLKKRLKKVDYTEQFSGVKVTTYVNYNSEELDQLVVEELKYQKSIRYYIGRIKNDENWLAAVKEKAEEKNIPLDSMIYLDAVYMVENE
jgi:mannosyltransferase